LSFAYLSLPPAKDFCWIKFFSGTKLSLDEASSLGVQYAGMWGVVATQAVTPTNTSWTRSTATAWSSATTASGTTWGTTSCTAWSRFGSLQQILPQQRITFTSRNSG
jgi:hypothetical protein